MGFSFLWMAGFSLLASLVPLKQETFCGRDQCVSSELFSFGLVYRWVLNWAISMFRVYGVGERREG